MARTERASSLMNLCLVSPSKDAYSETFIKAHIDCLPMKVTVLNGSSLPLSHGDRPLVPSAALAPRLMRAAQRTLMRLPAGYFQRSTLEQFLWANRIDAVLAEYGPTGVALAEVCQRTHIPLVVHFHGYDAYEEAALRDAGRHYPELFRVAAAVVAVSRDMERQLLKLGALREKLFYNPYGVDLSLFQGSDPAGVPPVFLAAGRFVDKKAPHLTLLAFRQVVEAVPEARLVMIGDGPLWEACKHLSRTLGLADAVHFAGPQPHAQVSARMREARAFVQHSLHTSYGDSEGMPVAILEAGAAGLPVVATRHAGIPEIVIEEQTGLLVDEGDVEGMAGRMVQLARDPALAARLGQAARARVAAEFPLEKSIQELGRILEAAVCKR